MAFDQKKYDVQYKKEHYEMIVIRCDKKLDYKNRLKVLSIGTRKTVTSLVIEAIDALLAKYDA